MLSDGSLRQSRWSNPNILSVSGQIILALGIYYTNEIMLSAIAGLAGIANYFNPPRTHLPRQ